MGLSRLTRYLLRELLGAWLAVTIVLLVVLLTNQLIQLMADAASGEIAPGLILSLLGLKAAANIGMVLPASFFLGAVLALSRLYRDSEITAMAGCGVGPSQLYRGIFALAIPLALLVASVTFSVGPSAERLADQVLADAEQQAQFAGLRPGRFVELGSGTTAYIAGVSDNSQMRQVFIERELPGRDVVWVADSGRRVVNALGRGEFLVLNNGWRFAGNPGSKTWQLMGYESYGVRIAEPQPINVDSGLAGAGKLSLLERGGIQGFVEIQRRLTPPLMVLILAIGSLPLARMNSNRSGYGQIVIAVLLFLIYFNIFYMAQGWVIDGKVPVWIGVGWVHLLAAGVAFFALWASFGFDRRSRVRA